MYATKLKTLGLRSNPLHDPPQQVIDSGTDAIRSYLVHSAKYDNFSKRKYIVSTVPVKISALNTKAIFFIFICIYEYILICA